MDIKRRSILLNAECNRLADETEREFSNPENDAARMSVLQDRARVYRQMAEQHMQTAFRSEVLRPEKFSQKNIGKQTRTRNRLAYTGSLIERYKTNHHGSLAQHAKEDFENSRLLWPDAETPEALANKVTSFLKNHC